MSGRHGKSLLVLIALLFFSGAAQAAERHLTLILKDGSDSEPHHHGTETKNTYPYADKGPLTGRTLRYYRRKKGLADTLALKGGPS
jgi:hypothetical protein